VRRKNPLTEEQIQSNVASVMEKWREGDFVDLLKSLLQANDHMSVEELTTQLNEANVKKNISRKHHSNGISNNLLKIERPSYFLIQDILDTNVLHLDVEKHPERSIPLYTKANLIEVNDDSIRHFNQEVFKRIESGIKEQGNSYHWADIMAKLLDFHTQGARDNYIQITQKLQESASVLTMPHPDKRLHEMLDKRCNISDKEAAALYDYLRLDEDQRKLMVSGKGINKELFTPTPTDFSKKLSEIFKKVINIPELMAETPSINHDIVTGKKRISIIHLYDMAKGERFTIHALRPVLDMLTHCIGKSGKKGERPLGQKDIDELIGFSGFSASDIKITSHEVIDRYDEQTAKLRNVLADIRNASDISVNTPFRAREWEVTDYSFPKPAQLRGLLEEYNETLKKRGHTPLDSKEIGKVLNIAHNNRERWSALAIEKQRDLKRPAAWCEMITAEVKPIQGNSIG
jgi:hypothetical protein